MFKKLKSLFVIEEGDVLPESKKTDQGSASSSGKEEGPSRPVSFVTDKNLTGHVQNKFLEVLFGALESNNQDGFDYLEFKDFLRSLANVPMDDATRIKSAFATAQTMGATKDKILSTARTYMEVLSKEEIKFQEALTGQRDKNLTAKHHEIKKLEQTIQDKNAEIEKLKNQIEEHRKHIGVLEQDINSASEKLAQTASDFEATYKTLLGQIQDDVKNIETHL